MKMNMYKKNTAEQSPFDISTEDIDPGWEDESQEVDLIELNAATRPFLELRAMESADRPEYGLESVKGEDHENREDQGFVNQEAGVMGCFDGCGGIAGGDLAAQTAAAELLPSVLDKRVSEAGETDKAKAENIKRIFTSESEAVLEQQDVESAMRDVLISMNESVINMADNNPEIQESARQRAAREVGKLITNMDDQALKAFMSRFGSTEKFIDLAKEKFVQSIGTTGSLLKKWRGQDGKDRVTVGQVGDSRIYRWRNGSLEKLTRDDSYIEAIQALGLPINEQDSDSLIDLKEVKNAIQAAEAKGEESESLDIVRGFVDKFAAKDQVRVGDIRSKMLRNIGGSKISQSEYGLDYKPQVKTYDSEPGDLYLNMSDGISDNLTDDLMAAIASKNSEDPTKVNQDLVSAARLVAGISKEAEITQLQADLKAQNPDWDDSRISKALKPAKAKVLRARFNDMFGIKLSPKQSELLVLRSKDDDITAVSMKV